MVCLLRDSAHVAAWCCRSGSRKSCTRSAALQLSSCARRADLVAALQAEVLRSRGKVTEAVSLFDQAVRMDPVNVHAHTLKVADRCPPALRLGCCVAVVPCMHCVLGATLTR